MTFKRVTEKWVMERCMTEKYVMEMWVTGKWRDNWGKR